MRWALILLAAMPPLPVPPDRDRSNDIMHLLLSSADLVVLAEIEDVGNGLVREANTHVSWSCKIRVLQVLKGKPPRNNLIPAAIDIRTGHPFTPRKGDRRVFFLQESGLIADPLYACADIRFGVQPECLAMELKRLADEDARSKADE